MRCPSSKWKPRTSTSRTTAISPSPLRRGPTRPRRFFFALPEEDWPGDSTLAAECLYLSSHRDATSHKLASDGKLGNSIGDLEGRDHARTPRLEILLQPPPGTVYWRPKQMFALGSQTRQVALGTPQSLSGRCAGTLSGPKRDHAFGNLDSPSWAPGKDASNGRKRCRCPED